MLAVFQVSYEGFDFDPLIVEVICCNAGLFNWSCSSQKGNKDIMPLCPCL